MRGFRVAALATLLASALPMAAAGQIVRSSPATASPAQIDPFSNPASNPYLNPFMAATTQPTNANTTLLYMLGARRYVQGQQEAAREREKDRSRSEADIRKARGQAVPGRLDAANSRYRFDSVRNSAGKPTDFPSDSRYGQTRSYYYR